MCGARGTPNTCCSFWVVTVQQIFCTIQCENGSRSSRPFEVFPSWCDSIFSCCSGRTPAAHSRWWKVDRVLNETIGVVRNLHLNISVREALLVPTWLVAASPNIKSATYSSRAFREVRGGGLRSAWNLLCTATYSSWVGMYVGRRIFV